MKNEESHSENGINEHIPK